MKLKLFIALAGFIFSASLAQAQVAYSSYNNSCTTYNACWQRMKLPSGSDRQFTKDVRDKLEACAAAGGPDKYFGKGKGGTGKLRPCP